MALSNTLVNCFSHFSSLQRTERMCKEIALHVFVVCQVFVQFSILNARDSSRKTISKCLLPRPVPFLTSIAFHPLVERLTMLLNKKYILEVAIKHFLFIAIACSTFDFILHFLTDSIRNFNCKKISQSMELKVQAQKGMNEFWNLSGIIVV